MEAAPMGLKRFYVINASVSLVALAALAWVLRLRPHHGEVPAVDLSFMPAVNAALNALSAVLVCTGLFFIKRGNRKLHQRFMVSALGASALFLVGYLAYHYFHGDTHYGTQGTLKTVYLVILGSHVVLSVVVLPLVLTTVFLALTQRFPLHVKVARVTVWLWLYVSVTGVVIFFMLRGSLPAAHAVV